MQKISRIEGMVCGACDEDLPSEGGVPTGFEMLPKSPFDAWLTRNFDLGPIRRRTYVCPECGARNTTLEMSDTTLGVLLDEVPGRAAFLKERAVEYAQEVGAEARLANAHFEERVAEEVRGSVRPAAFMSDPFLPSAELSRVIGSDPTSRSEAVAKLWSYIKSHQLQDKVNLRVIHTDENLLQVFGKSQVTMFEITGLIGKHLSKA